FGDFGPDVSEGDVLSLAPTGFDASAQYLFFIAGPNAAGTNNDYLFYKATTTSSTVVNTATVTPPNGFTDSNSGNNSSTDTDNVVRPAALGDFVWNDANGNGIQDSGESGIAGVTVKLIGAGVDGIFNTGDDVTLATTTTDTNGLYHFTNLTPGSYEVQFIKPTGYVFTTQNAGSDDAVDSDANTSTGKSQVVTIAAGQTNNTIDAGLHHTSAFTPDVFDGTIGFWKTHQAAWNGSTADNSSVANLVSSGVLSKYDVLPTGVDSNGDGHINDSDRGVLIGDMNGNGKTDAGETTLFIPLAAAQLIIDPTHSSNDARLIFMRQAIAAQLNIDNGHHDPNDIVGEAAKWLRGQAPFTYTDGSTGKIGNGDGVLQSSEYTISGGNFSLTGTAQGTGTQAWNQQVDVYGGPIANDWDNNPSLAGNQEASGQDLKNGLQAFNSGQLVTSTDGSQVGLYNGVFVDFAHANTTDSFWLTLHDGGLI
ncbi:MAG TPA: SdrD B-like domain-containing protein, partial [Micropepsaceae bacterium]|nr:SdrD B-like domain-containing protein [Micropepsaceae bacterium]